MFEVLGATRMELRTESKAKVAAVHAELSRPTEENARRGGKILEMIVNGMAVPADTPAVAAGGCSCGCNTSQRLLN